MNKDNNLGSILQDSKSERDKKDKDNKEVKLPFDMKSFWKNLNEKYFKRIKDININEINHTILFQSKYGKI
jgi:hypothetical protein